MSPAASCLPWTLPPYSVAWSTRCFGANVRISSALLWQRAHVAITACPDGLPRNAIAATRPSASCASTLSALVGLPPWQSTQSKPRSRWTSCPEKSCAGAASRASGNVEWQRTHVFAMGAGVCARAVEGASTAPIANNMSDAKCGDLS